MPVSLVADAQVVVWYLREPGRLTEKAASALQAVTATGNLIGVSAFSIVELIYAAEKRTNPFTLVSRSADRIDERRCITDVSIRCVSTRPVSDTPYT